MKSLKRLIMNLDSIREGLQLWLMFSVLGFIGGLVIGAGWAKKEILDAWELT